jgi:hypothetical protein
MQSQLEYRLPSLTVQSFSYALILIFSGLCDLFHGRVAWRTEFRTPSEVECTSGAAEVYVPMGHQITPFFNHIYSLQVGHMPLLSSLVVVLVFLPQAERTCLLIELSAAVECPHCQYWFGLRRLKLKQDRLEQNVDSGNFFLPEWEGGAVRSSMSLCSPKSMLITKS